SLALSGYHGSFDVTAGSDGDNVTMNGNAEHLLWLTADPTTLTTNMNTPVNFTPTLHTSLTDTYTLTIEAPNGWNVEIGLNDLVTITPAAGLQGGSYQIQVKAQSHSRPELAACAHVTVNMVPTQPGISLEILPDTFLTVPVNGAQLPSAYQIKVHN